MATDTTAKIQGLVEVILKGDGAKDGRNQVVDFEKEADRLGRRLRTQASPEMARFRQRTQQAGRGLDTARGKASKFGGVLGALRGQLLAVFGGAALGSLIRSSVSDFAAYERQLTGIATQLDNVGISSTKALPGVRQFLEALEQATGIARQNSATELQRFIGITGDLNAAMVLTKTAAGVAESGLKDFGSAATLLGSLMQGEVIEPAKSLGIAVRDSSGALKGQEQILDEVIDRYFEMAGSQEDTQSTLGKLSGDWNDFKVSLGEGFAQLVNLIGGFRNITRVIKSLGPIAVKTGLQIVGFLRGAQRAQISFIANFKKALTGDFSGLFEGAREAFDQGFDTVKDQIKGAEDELDAIWFEMGVSNAQAEEDGKEKLRKIARAKARELAAKEAADLAEKAEQERVRREEREIQAEIRLLNTKANLHKRGSAERLKIEQEILRKTRDFALRNVEETSREAQLIWMQFDEAMAALEDEKGELELERAERIARRVAEIRQEIIEEQIQWELERAREGSEEQQELEIALLEARRDFELQHTEATEAEKAAIREKWANRITRADQDAVKSRIKWAELEAEQKVDAALQAASAVVGALQGLFGESKGFAIAQAIIDTAAAVNRTLASLPYPANVIAAIGVGVQGLANVRKIQSTEPGTAGAASFGSGSISTGGVASLAAPSATIPVLPSLDNERGRSGERRVVNNNFNGPLITDRRTYQLLARKLRQAERSDRSRFTR